MLQVPVIARTHERRTTMSASPLRWFKSSLSFSNGACVEVAELPDGGMAMRNSRHPNGSVLEFTPLEWDAFIGGVRRGEFNRVIPQGG